MLVKGEAVSSEHVHGLLTGIGRTPLIELDIVEEVAPDVRLFAKLESVNPGASIKDRPVARMLVDAWRKGIFDDGRRLLDSSSGNAGISYAMLGAALGIPVTIIVPGNASQERQDRIAAHGAELILTDPIEGYDFALREAHRLAKQKPDRYWHCDQYANDNNWLAHYHGTGIEIIDQVRAHTGAPADCFVAGVGTGGTITGAGRRLREDNPDIHIAAIIPELFPGIEGLKPLGDPNDIVPKILDESIIDQRIPMSLLESTDMCARLAKQGLFVGPSSGGYVTAALELAQSGKFRTIVTILSDSGERYGSTGMWNRK